MTSLAAIPRGIGYRSARGCGGYTTICCEAPRFVTSYFVVRTSYFPRPMLYLVATPIGNLEDISLRALKTLREVDVVASEDTRKTGLLLKHFEIQKPQVAFHEHNEERAGERIMELIAEGKRVALVTNAGTPGIADPGFTLVRRAIRAGSTSTTSATPSFMVTASGWAPPMPPSPAVSVRRPRRVPPKCRRARAASVSYVPCRIPCVPM